jgi:predicted amidohydrolase YtcJ
MTELLLHGRVFTADPDKPWAEAVVVRDDLIAFVGTLDDARSATGPKAAVLDVANGVIVPGFVDAHSHLLGTGASLLRAQLRGARSLEDIATCLSEWIDEHSEAQRVLGIGWLFSALPLGGPTRQLLDAIVPDRPAYLEANDLHSVWVNSRALAEMGIHDGTPDPIGGTIARDASGRATGLLLENAGYRFAWPVMFAADDNTRDSWLAAIVAAYHAAGTTTAVDMGLDEASFSTMLRAAKRGHLGLHVIGHWLINRTGDAAQEIAQVENVVALAAEHQHDHLRIAGIKVIVDGTIDACTAGMLAPYNNGQPGHLIWDRRALEPVVIAADSAGLQIAMHAIGDLAVRTAIDVLETAALRRGAQADTTERRHRIEHLEYVDEIDVARMAPLGITASMQPVHCDPAIMPNWVAMIGEQRANRGFAWPEYLASGTRLVFGTDTPTAPFQPLPNMYIAATRRSPDDPTLAPHRADFSLRLDDAVVHATRDAAWASFAEHQVGMIRAGLSADLVVLDRNPFDAMPEMLLDTRVLRTISAGRTVFAAP